MKDYCCWGTRLRLRRKRSIVGSFPFWMVDAVPKLLLLQGSLSKVGKHRRHLHVTSEFIGTRALPLRSSSSSRLFHQRNLPRQWCVQKYHRQKRSRSHHHHIYIRSLIPKIYYYIHFICLTYYALLHFIKYFQVLHKWHEDNLSGELINNILNL